MWNNITGDLLHSRAAWTQPCNVNTHSHAHCSPGAWLCEQWGHGCVKNGARLCASARLCRGSPVNIVFRINIKCIQLNNWIEQGCITCTNKCKTVSIIFGIWMEMGRKNSNVSKTDFSIVCLKSGEKIIRSLSNIQWHTWIIKKWSNGTFKRVGCSRPTPDHGDWVTIPVRQNLWAIPLFTDSEIPSFLVNC